MFDFLFNIEAVPALSGILAFLAAALLVGGVSAFAAERERAQRRLAPSSPVEFGRPESGYRVTLEDGFLKKFDAYVTPKKQEELTQVRKRMIRAGYRRPSAVRLYYAARALFAAGFALIGAALAPLLAVQFPLPIVGLSILMLALLGIIVPSFWIEREIEYRRQAAELGFPDALDMLLICMEAGNSLDQACRRVAREIKKVNKVLADELGVVNDELYAGKSRAAVFRDFSDRIAVADISAFAAVLRQSDEFGVSIAETLRVYSSELRNKRLMRAEAKANLMPIKLALGSIAFTIPPTLLILAGPSVIMILRTIGGIGG
jgi:tight adherence protein C